MTENIAEVKTEFTMDMFMKGKAKVTPIVERVVSKRYVDGENNAVPFKFKAISSTRIEELQEDCTIKVRNKKGKVVEEKTDYQRFGALMGIETTVFPDFSDEKLLKSYGLIDSVELVKEILNVGGEYAEWVKVVQEVNGFDEEFDELVEEAKN